MVNSTPTTVKNSDANNVNSSSSQALKPSVNLSLLFNQFNNFCPDLNSEPGDVVSSSY